jgi:hypothetical protein
VIDLLDATLDESLLLARGVVLGVLAQVAVRPSLGDRLYDPRPILGLEPPKLNSKPLRSL